MLEIIPGALYFLALLGVPAAPTPEAFEKSTVVPKVVCRADPEETYALYLPSGYDTARPGPILYLLDARRRGTLAAERFRAAAEKYGWILASSNNSESDGPFAPNFHAMRAMWADTHERFVIDPRRVYMAGFSGTARGACMLAQTADRGQIAGVFGCAAGFADNSPPMKDPAFLYFSTVGNRDFNYREMRRLDATLAALGVPHRLAVFDGAHDWPPSEVCVRAFEWMEAGAMRSGARPRNDALVAEWLASSLKEAEALETSGKKGEALTRYREIAADFDGLGDPSAARSAVERLETDGAARELEKQARLEEQEDRTFNELSQKLMADLGSEEPLPAQRVIQDLRLAQLHRTAASAQTEAERLSARRLLAALSVQTSFYLPRQYLERRDTRRAELCTAVALEVQPDRAGFVLYNYACLQALAGDKKGALVTLRSAVDKGFRDGALMEKDPDLDNLRGEEGYKRIVEELKKAAAAS